MKFFTYRGKEIDLDRIDESQICIEDIAWSLSMQCRWQGHVKQFYSVAEHSLYCSLMAQRVNEESALAALLHDATEAYIGDIIRPIKERLPKLIMAEEALMSVIDRKFGTDWDRHKDLVKEVDMRMLATEAMELCPGLTEDAWRLFPSEATPYPINIACYEPREAYECFMFQFEDLTETK